MTGDGQNDQWIVTSHSDLATWIDTSNWYRENCIVCEGSSNARCGFCTVTGHIAIPFQPHIQGAHCEVLSQLAALPQRLCKIGDKQSENTRWNCGRWVICNTIHLHNVFWSLEASRSVWEDVECKLCNVNVRRVSDLWRTFWPPFRRKWNLY
jgi:hypothetical protein